jgi:serine O-acetyltransferase
MIISFFRTDDASGEPCQYPELGGVVGELRQLRAKAEADQYQGGRAPALLSQDAVRDIVDGLVAVLFPRHFGPSGMRPEDTDGFVGHTLNSTLRLLHEQVWREIKLTASQTGAASEELDRSAIDARAIDIVRRFAATLPKIRTLLDTDSLAALDGDPAAKTLDEVVFCYPGVRALIRHRIAHELYLLGARILARIIAEAAHSETGIDINPGAVIGERFFIDHGTGVVIGETAIIGRNVRLYQAVTLGAKTFAVDESGALVKGQPRHPVVEDDVVIYAGATILGRITIGRGSVIGGNVWLTQSTPPGSRITQARPRGEVFDDGGGI